MKELRDVPGIPLLLGALFVKSLGLTIAFMEYVGECLDYLDMMDLVIMCVAYYSLFFLLNLDPRSKVKKILTTIHDHGWHHHDLDNAANIVKSEFEDTYFVIDYGMAERVMEHAECTLGQDCPDLAFLGISDITAVTATTDETLFATSPTSSPREDASPNTPKWMSFFGL